MDWGKKTVKEILEESYGEDAAKEILAEIDEVTSKTDDPDALTKNMDAIFRKHSKSLDPEVAGSGAAIGTATGAIMGEAIGVK